MTDQSSHGDFANLAWLFTSDNRNRGILRQNFNEAALLWRAVRASRGAILEIGRRYGGSTVVLIEASGGRPITSIDLAPAHNPACDEVFRSAENLRLVVGDSRKRIEAASFGFAFIDGDHTYDGVKGDLRAHWRSLHAISGIPPTAVFHDAVPNDGLQHNNKPNHHEGVRLACEELVKAGCAEVIESAGSSLWVRKTGELPSTY